LFGAVTARGAAAAELTDAAWLQAMLDVEAALARALARAGLVPAAAAQAVVVMAQPARISLAELAAGTAAAGNPIASLVEQLGRSLPREATNALHRGATSQDVIDSALMLIARRALAHVIADLRAAADNAAELARAHRESVMVGRTLLQHAVPVTFGLKAAGWLWALDDAWLRLSVVRRSQLLVQYGGAAGTLAPLGERGVEIMRLLAAELELGEPVLAWHTLRAPVLVLAQAAGLAAAALGKIARDVVLLAQTEVGELQESAAAERGSSSTMPHKHNPVGSVAVLSCTRRLPGLIATLLAAAEQEHERAAGAWHAEWETLTELLRLLGSAASWLRELLSGLQVNTERMRANLEATRGLVFAERLGSTLAPRLGRFEAEALVRAAVNRAQTGHMHLRDVLLHEADLAKPLEEAGLLPQQIAALFDPSTYLGSSAQFIERALAAHAAARITP
jgi:3-carboxy-cis,cis-muconate cycloisomerase